MCCWGCWVFEGLWLATGKLLGECSLEGVLPLRFGEVTEGLVRFLKTCKHLKHVDIQEILNAGFISETKVDGSVCQ